MKKTRESSARSGGFVVSALMASAAIGMAARPALANDRPKSRYDEAIVDVIRSMRGPAADTEQARAGERFDIVPGPLSTAVTAFERTTGIEVTLATGALGEIHTPGVAGVFTAEQALQQMLSATGLAYRFTSPRAVTIDIAGQTEFVEVSSTARPVASSPKFTSAPRDIPQTMTIISSDVIEAQGATTLRDVLRNVPGITFQAGEGGGGLPGDTFTMRGFSAANDMFVDGLRDTGGYSRDAFNIEQVEVVKGPSSSIAGRGATGGAVNQVTKSPTLADTHQASVSTGNAAFRRGTLDLNRNLSQLGSGAAVRLNAMWTDSGVPGRDLVENRSWGVAPSVAFGLLAPTQVVLKYQHLRQDNVPDYGLPWGNYPGYPTGAFAADPPVDQSNFYGLRGYDFEDITSDVATVDVNHRVSGNATLRNVSRYSDTERDSAITAPRPPNRQLQRRTMGNENLANSTNVTLLFGGTRVRHELVSGVELSRERTSNQNSAQSTNQPAVDLVNPDPEQRPLGLMPPNSGNPSRTTLSQGGAYAFDTVHVGERWQFTGGVRYDVVEVDYSLTTLATGEETRLEASNREASWRGGVVFKPAPAGSIYVGAGTSFNPSVDAAATGAALSTAPNAANNPNLEPERTRNYEVGTKWDVAGGRLSLNGAIFRTEKHNARTRNANSDPFVLSGRQRVAGVEVGVAGTIRPGWNALASYAFMDSAIEASANAAEEGQNLTLTPEHTFSAWSSYTLPRGVTLGAGVQYMDAVFRNTLNTQRVPSYWLTNALASYRVNDMLTLRLNAQNLGDRQYVDRVGGGHYIPGPRRQATLAADLSF